MLKPLEAGNSIKQLILESEQPETLRGIIKKVNRVTRHLHIQVGGYGLLRSVPVNRGINLGTPDRKVVFPGDTAVIVRGRRGWQCIAVEHKDRCGSKVSEFTGDVVIENEVEPVSGDSYVSQQVGALSLPTDLYLPPFQLLGNLTLASERFDPQLLICGLPRCTDCAPTGYVLGYVLKISSDAENPGGCWIWGPRQPVQGGVLWMVANEFVGVIDTFVSTQITILAPGERNIELGLPQDAIHLYTPAASSLLSDIWRSLDGVTYASVYEGHEISRANNPFVGHVLNFDRTSRSLGYGMSFLSVFDDQEVRQPLQVYIDAVRDEWYPPAAGEYPVSIASTELDWFFEGLTVYAVISIDGGITWTEYAIDNLGELVPSRIGGTLQEIDNTFYTTFGCFLTTSGNPFSVPEVVYTDGGDFTDPADLVQFVVCVPPYDPDDPEAKPLHEVFFPSIVGIFGTVAKQNGLGFYIFIETAHIGEQLDSGLYTSPWSPWIDGINGGALMEFVWTQWVWSINNSGVATRIDIPLGAEFAGFVDFDGTDNTGNVHAFIKGAAVPNTDHIFTLFTKKIGFDFYFGCDEIDFSAATATDLAAPFDTDLTMDALDLVCTSAGTLFVYVRKDDFSESRIWRYDGAWTSLDVTAQSVGTALFTFSQIDTKLYLLFEDNVLGESVDDGLNWTFTPVTGDPYAMNDVDTY